MRPLSPNFKAACFFYLGFATILVMVTFGYASGLTAQIVSNDAPNSRVYVLPEQLIDLNNNIIKLWDQYLREEETTQGFFKEQTTKLQSQKVSNKKIISWALTKETIELPAATSEDNLVNLGIEWSRLVQKKGIAISKIDWGYNDNRLWLKINSEAPVNTGEAIIKLPIAEIMIVQPFNNITKNQWNWRGLIPMPQPEISVVEELPREKVQEPLKTEKEQTKPKTDVIKSEISQEKKRAEDKQLVTSPLIEPQPIPGPVKPKIPLPVKRRAKVAIIIDDVGFIRGPADRMLQVPARLTWAILPLSPYGAEYARAAFEQGGEIILHQPLEPLNPREDPGPGLIRRDWSPEEIRQQFENNLADIPYVKGLNNHMGSAGTIDEYLMENLMQIIREKKLFFIDSYTNNKSIAIKFARKNAVPFAKRSIFIDHYSDYELKKQALRQLIKIALRDGTAIAIGHVRDGTAEAIEEMLPEIIKAGIEIVPVSELVK